jgi:FkbH-like protein
LDPAGTALSRAEWQRALFNAPNRADLVACVPAWPLRSMPVRVHRNHGFEAVSSATRAYAAWNGLDFEWLIGGYDDSLSFDLAGDAHVELVWLDTSRLQDLEEDGIVDWLIGRLRALRSQTTHPILVLAWPLSTRAVNRLDEATIPGTHVANLAPLAAILGRQWIDSRAQALSGTRLGNHACLAIARELACRWLPAVSLPPRKAIAVDLDGTLYAGTLGEEGAAGVELTEGHRVLQRHLVGLRNEGMLLAVVSRNEPADVEALFAQRADFPLRLSDFSAVEVSWDDKAAAVGRIASTLRIGCDSIVFVDDNPGELAGVAASLPVVTVHAGSDGTQTVSALEHVAGVFRWRTTDEDRLRADDLRASEVREEIAQAAFSPDDYLRSLQVQLDVLVGPRQHLARLAELSAKTNQFNLSLSRMNEAQIARRLSDAPSNVVAIRLTDRLSDSGIVGLVVGSRIGKALHIDELCVSCRALGRRIEDTMLTQAVLAMAGEPAPETVVFAVRKGPRNAPARDWLARYGGARVNDDTDAVEFPFKIVVAHPLSSSIRMEIVR